MIKIHVIAPPRWPCGADGGKPEKGIDPAYEKNPFSRPASAFIRLCRRL